jgi:hypothetical protein
MNREISYTHVQNHAKIRMEWKNINYFVRVVDSKTSTMMKSNYRVNK